MANHKSAIKRIRQSESRKVENKYYARSMRSAVRNLRGTSDKAIATELSPKVFSLIDKVAKKGIIHKNKAGNLKSSLAKHISSLA